MNVQWTWKFFWFKILNRWSKFSETLEYAVFNSHCMCIAVVVNLCSPLIECEIKYNEINGSCNIYFNLIFIYLFDYILFHIHFISGDPN